MNSEQFHIPRTEKRFAVGNDLVYLPAFEQSFTRDFKEKVYTDQEVAYCERFAPSLIQYASTWAAKEAVYKAVKQVFLAPLPFNKIEVLREDIGKKPYAVIHKATEELVPISLSISHDGDYAWAIAILEIP